MTIGRVVISIPTESAQGPLGPGYYGRYWAGNAPGGASLAAAAADATSATGALTADGMLVGAAIDSTAASAALTVSAALVGAAADTTSASATLNETTFDYYIGPRAGVDTNPDGVAAGNDSNAGTLAAPWAVTSLRCGNFGTSPNFTNYINGKGVRIGFLPGVYDISALLVADALSGGLQFPGGNSTNVNYFASSNAAGIYSARTATFDGRGASHLYGNGDSYPAEPPIISHVGEGEGSVAYTLGYLAIDGIRLTGWCYRAIRIGAQSYGGPANIVDPVLITNCEFFYGAGNQVGQVMTYTLTDGGSGYVPTSGTQTYYNVPLTGGSGNYATADITVTNGVVTAVGAQSAAPNFANAGQSYVVNDSLSASNANLGGSGSGLVITVNTVGSSATEEDNCPALWLDHSTNCVTATNNWFHDSWGHAVNSGDHFNAIQLWGNSDTCIGTKITYNTCVRAGNIYGKEYGIEATIITNNYLDVSNLTAAACGIQDFTGNQATEAGGSPALSGTTVLANNIVLVAGGDGAGVWDALGGVSTDYENALAWNTPVQIRNNTLINVASGGGAIFLEVDCNAGTAAVGAVQAWNNLYYNPGGGSGGGPGGAGNGNVRANPQSLSLLDYNMYPSSNVTWAIAANANPLSTTSSSYSSAAAFATAYATAGGISGVEAHSLTGTPTFVGSGTLAAHYQLTSGSTGHLAGSTTGTTSGTATDMGAWGGLDYNTGSAVTQIGCNFATSI